MKTALFAAAALALSAAAASPAIAQVNGIGTVNTPAAIYSSQARAAAYEQIFTANATQIQQLQTLQQQRDAVMVQFDTDQSGDLSEAEIVAAQGNATAVQQLQTLEQSIAQVQSPITAAQVYAIEQILQQYNTAVQQVIAEKGVQMILDPEVIVYAPAEVSLNDEIVAKLNQLVPAVSTTVPEAWRPLQDSVAIWQQIQEIMQALALRAQQQQAAAAAQQQPQQPVEGR